VTIDGRVAELGNRVDPDRQVICVDDRWRRRPEHRVLLLNKPDGVVTTASDPHGRPTVLELVESPVRYFPSVARHEHRGLLILTNDGRLPICSPIRVRDPKEYLARVEATLAGGDSAPA